MLVLRRLRAALRTARSALPLESLAILAAVAIGWFAVLVDPRGDAIVRAGVLPVIATPLLFAVTLLARRRPAPPRGALLALRAGAVALAAGAALVGRGDGLDHATDDAVFVVPLLAALALGAFAPFVAVALAAPASERRRAFADFVRRFCEETTAVGLLAGAALAALAILAVALHQLFDLDVGKPLALAVVSVLGLAALAYLVRLLPEGAPREVPAIWRHLVVVVVAPFVALLLGVLGAYELSLLARGELPRNVLSPLIVVAGLCGLVATIVIDSLTLAREERALSQAEPHPWQRALTVRLARGFAPLLLALLPLAAIALLIRIDEHALTPIRVVRLYLLVGLAVVTAWSTVRLVRRRPPLGWQVAAIGAAVALVAGFGPIGAVSLSIRSQAARIDRDLTALGIAARTVGPDLGAAARPVEREAYHALDRRMWDLERLGGRAALARVLDGDLARCAGSCLAELGVRPDGFPLPAGGERYLHASSTIAGRAFVAHDVFLTQGDTRAVGAHTLTLTGSILELRGAPAVASADLGGWKDAIAIERAISLVGTRGCEQGALLPRSMTAQPNGWVRELSGTLLIWTGDIGCQAD